MSKDGKDESEAGTMWWPLMPPMHQTDKSLLPPKQERQITRKVTDRYCKLAGTAADLTTRMEKLIRDYTQAIRNGATYAERSAIGQEFEKWFLDTFRVGLSTTPRGGKDIKAKANSFLWYPKAVVSMRSGEGTDPKNWGGLQELRNKWEEFKPVVPDLVRLFTDEGSTKMLREIKGTYATYQNTRGLATKTFQKYVVALESLFGTIRGWRAKALGSNLTVSLAGPDAFRGTAAGKYVRDKDTLVVRATPKIMKRTPGKYGSPDYILIHELGHRYDVRHGTGGVDFQQTQWYTTQYSRTEGFSGLSEAFAELFALGHFGIRNVRSDFGGVVDRFEEVMK